MIDNVNLIIPGCQKSGTTSFFETLLLNRSLGGGLVKEPHYFSKNDNFDKGLDYYLENFKNQEQKKYIIDASQSYFSVDGSLQRIKQCLSPDTKFIILFREPVERALSAYNFYKYIIRSEFRNLEEILPDKGIYHSIYDFIESENLNTRQALSQGSVTSRNPNWDLSNFPYSYFFHSCYSIHLKKYLSEFPIENFLFLSFEEFVQNRSKTLEKVSSFLDIPNDFEDREIIANKTVYFTNTTYSSIRQKLSPLKGLIPTSMFKYFKAIEERHLMSGKEILSTSQKAGLVELFGEEYENIYKLTGIRYFD